MPDSRSIRIGTSGFSYDDWIGVFYPPSLPKGRWLEFYSARFDCLEINSTYYEWLASRVMENFANRVPASFRFSVKLHHSLTHERKELQKGVFATIEQNKPLTQSDVLATQLAQFPPSFRNTKASWEWLKRLSDGIKPLTVEFRHASWQIPETMENLRKMDVSYCCVDQPKLPGLLQWQPVVTVSPAYVRFHGRNAENWHVHEHAWQRYNYLYSEEQLSERATDVLEMSRHACETLIFFNNHYAAQAIVNARQFAKILGIIETEHQNDQQREEEKQKSLF